MKLHSNKKRIIITAASIVLILFVGIIGASLIYVNDYYRADEEAIEASELMDDASYRTLDDGTILFEPQNAKCGFIFYPGGKVEYTAYLPLMAAISDMGIACALVDMPFNLAVLDVNRADGIQELLPEVEHWYIGGHSLGGSMAASYISSHEDSFDGLILLGSYSTADLSKTDLSVLSLYGSEDKVMNREKYEANKKNLPKDFCESVITGANHAGFGMYGSQDGDGTATMTAEEQAAITAYKITHFILE